MTRHVIEKIDRMRDILTSKMTGLPLGILSASECESTTRYCSPYPPVAHPLLHGSREDVKEAMQELTGVSVSLVVKPIVLICTLESSGKWPSDPEASKRSKTAFLLRISEILKSQFDIKSFAQSDFLDVYYEGYLLRLKIKLPTAAATGAGAVEGEAALVTSVKTTDDYSAFNKVDKLDFSLIHHQAIRAVHSQFPSFSRASRLCVQWANEHLFSGHLSPETIELLVASVYLSPNRHNVPSTPTAGFIQALCRLSSWDWSEEPLSLDFSGTLSYASRQQFLTQFHGLRSAQRQQVGGSRWLCPSVCIAAVYQEHGRLLINPSSFQKPEPSVFPLIVDAARSTVQSYLSSLQRVHNPLTSAADADTGSTSSDYEAVLLKCNVILKMRSCLVCPHNESPSGISNTPSLASVAHGPAFASIRLFANLPSKEFIGQKLIVSEDSISSPVQAKLVNRLTSQFGHIALFFWNASLGDLIGIVWRPKPLISPTFSILDSRHQLAVPGLKIGAATAEEADTAFVLNFAEVIGDIVSACDGCVEDLQIR